MAEKVLVTGGAGYIGSHTVLELLEAGYLPVVIDNFCNAIRGEGSMPESLRRVQELTGRSVEFEEMDILDQAALQRLFKKHSFMAVIHFAGLKAVGESVQKPLDYYRVNLTGTIQLLETMRAHGVKNLVFSSSATVYGNPQYLPLDEAHPTGGCTNPYGKSKFFIEEMIRDLCQADKAWNAVLLRYFNPIGAHASGCIGEDPQGIPNNLMPYVSQVAIGRREALNVFGNDYDTEDGTGVRDYIHVVDLAKGHIAALRKLKEQCGCRIYNLGTGTGYSVLQMVQAMEKASGKKVKISGAGRSRTLQALARRPETFPCRGPGKERETTACSPASGRNPGVSEALLPQTPAGPAQPTRHEAKGPSDLESGVSNSSLSESRNPSGSPRTRWGGRALKQNTLLPGANLYCYEEVFQSI
ncbi:UDP-glucose 4-epimerase isoform X1 [Equus quagga]|uniref:UDP-glucose 4-epimerase isoform X1 n=1 Tax=Equus quagga TaxID=89248 RepID=UPI001EE27A16|nr:UDP-glucose 4-epimerase isoform X1 [Equus quagga]XP_046517397.1 UDP-glucose 4-epimerase isoform X1 [Equus quagga]